jgi:hypothetical protein
MVEISKVKLSNIIWIVFFLGVVCGYLAHDNRDAIEINNAARDLQEHRQDYMNTTFLLPESIFIIEGEINGTKENK